MELYGKWNDPATWRVRIALELKGVSYDIVPMEKLPNGCTLDVNYAGQTHRLGQTLAILDFLEERYPSPALLPRDLILRARTRQLAEILSAAQEPQQIPSVLKRLGAFQAVAATTAGKFSVGDSPTWADACLIPDLFIARKLKISLEPFELLTNIESECARLRAFQNAHATTQTEAPKSP